MCWNKFEKFAMGIILWGVAILLILGGGAGLAGESDNGIGSSNLAIKTNAQWIGTDWTGSGKAQLFCKFEEDGDDMLSYCSIVDGALKIDTSASPSVMPGFFSPETPFGRKFTHLTIIARVKADNTFAAAVDFDLYAAGYRQRVQLGPGNKISLSGLDGSVTNSTVDLTQWHTYLIAFTKADKGLKTELYVDGSATPLLSGISSRTNNKTHLKIGDGSGSTAYSGYIDWFYYTTDGAFTPNNVLLPPGIHLN